MKHALLALTVLTVALGIAVPVEASESSASDDPGTFVVAFSSAAGTDVAPSCTAGEQPTASDLLLDGDLDATETATSCVDASDCPCPELCFCAQNQETGERVCLCSTECCFDEPCS